jgi:hypothetical protein
MNNIIDFYFVNAGSIILLKPQNDTAREWTKANLNTESWQNTAFGIPIEPRYFDQIYEGIQDEGF